MRGRRIQMEIIFLNIFAVVSFVTCQSEKPLLQNRIPPIPECHRKTNPLQNVANSSDAVFAPSVGARTRGMVWKIFPRRAIWTVIFADRSPLSSAQIRSPALPVDFAQVRFFQPLIFRAQRTNWFGHCWRVPTSTSQPCSLRAPRPY